jgi:hypothetical protein
MTYILKFVLFSNEKKVQVFWKLMIEKKECENKIKQTKICSQEQYTHHIMNNEFFISFGE